MSKVKKEKMDSESIDNIEKVEQLPSVESTVDTSFFYTLDKFINTLDDDAILRKIQTKYKDIDVLNTDSQIKKSIALFLNDEIFVQYILDYYSITIFELFKIMYKKYSILFKGPYIKKIKKIIADKKYAKNNNI